MKNIPVTRDRQPEKMAMEASAAGSWAKGWQAGSCGVVCFGVSVVLTSLPSTAGRVVGMCFVSAYSTISKNSKKISLEVSLP